MQEYIDLKVDFAKRNAQLSGMTLESVVVRSCDTAIKFRIEIADHVLDDTYDVKILSKYSASNLKVMNTLKSGLEIADGKIIYTPKVNLITEADYVRNFLYLSKDGLGLDMAQFNYEVDVSQIGEVAVEVKQVYDESYETLITEFEQALEDYKLTLPQADSLRADIDEILNQFGVDSQTAIGDLNDVSAAVEVAEASRVEKESERIQAETERKEAETLREENYEQLIDTAIIEADVVEKVDNKVTELTPQINQLTAQLAQKAEQADLIVQRERISQLVANAGDTDGNAELLDIRLKGDGSTAISAGDAVRSQYMELKNAITSGEITESKDVVALKYPTYKNEYLIDANPTQIGKALDELRYSGSAGARNYLIDVSNVTRITFPMFKTSEYWGCLLLDEENVVIKTVPNRTLETGTQRTLDIPTGATKFLLSISNSLSTLNWNIGFPTPLNLRIYELENDMSISIEQQDLKSMYPIVYENRLLDALNSLDLHISNVNKGGLANAYSISIDVSEYVAIDYPVFKSTDGRGSLILNDQDVVIWQHSETIESIGSLKRVILPKGSKTFLLNVSAILSKMDFMVNLYHKYTPRMLQEILLDDEPIEDNQTVNYSDLALCSMVTKYKKDKKPFHEGYLFHSLRAGDESLYYGDRMDKLKKIGEVDFNTNNSMLAISPKDKRVVATERGVKSELYVWDGETTHVLFNDVTGPKGWLYNSGVDFIEDENGDEYCIFAEYGGDATIQTGGFYVWRGVYPYTSESDWEKVLFQDYGGSEGIDHFHMVRKDPWTNLIYLTSGDWNPQSKWWYSEDDGKNWTMFARGSTSGFEEHVMRCINFIFTEDYVYWAVDHGRNHSLNRIKRNTETGILDLSTREMLTELPEGQATNSITYSHYPEGIFMFDRWDYGTAFEQYFDLPIKVQFWDIEREELVEVTEVKKRYSSWGGHRGQAYINYTNPYNPYPAIGFSDDTRNPFEVPVDNPSQVGTIHYDISGGSMNLLS